MGKERETNDAKQRKSAADDRALFQERKAAELEESARKAQEEKDEHMRKAQLAEIAVSHRDDLVAQAQKKQKEAEDACLRMKDRAEAAEKQVAEQKCQFEQQVAELNRRLACAEEALSAERAERERERAPSELEEYNVVSEPNVDMPEATINDWDVI